ncbi:NAD(P)-dependent alcohol dehydrogenase [Saccharopolyspora mangrovi]|uniref:NAD(P)-dependent alcohol dehydrogenase n=1 Tax=Saccharopolyspora mangrovi TaxID=3082379 RepID=A0ABU6AIE3_9PSEU|nr:NAD(P)-dependent alcohol dehydrogenase [Saccharopolyspora sp. S2-29]MEB3371334.1 NAD(P)-dependent alcohol dehydrogenase [Saccharopolyspora sp. S2-29]
MEIRAALLREAGEPLIVETAELEAPRAEEVLVRMAGTGVCHTDLGFCATAGAEQLPFVLGHEGAGVVEAVGAEVRTVAVGDHVVLSYASCGGCRNCLRNRPQYCASNVGLNFGGARLDGTTALRAGSTAVHTHFFGQSSFADYAVTYERNCVTVDKDLPLELLGPLGCGLQTGAGAVLNALDVRPGDSLAVFGVGSVGLAAVMAGAIAGAEHIVAVDRNPDRLALASELGATTIVDAAATDPVEAVRDATGGGVDHSVDCVGAGTVISQALSVLVPPGTCITLGLQGMVNEITVDQAALLFGRSLRGVLEGDSIPDVFIPRLLQEYRAGRFPIEKLVRTFKFNEINDAIAAAAEQSVIKPVVIFDS